MGPSCQGPGRPWRSVGAPGRTGRRRRPRPRSAARPAAAPGVRRTRAIRRPSSSVTVNRRPSAATLSPSSGSRPSSLITKPATVSYGPSGSSRPVRSSKSSRLSRPSTSRSPSTRRARRLLGDVVLVADVADELLDQVLQRDDAVGAAVLVDDDRQVVALAAHLRQRGEHPLGARHHLDLAGDLADPHRRAGDLRARTGRARARSRRRRRASRATTG